MFCSEFPKSFVTVQLFCINFQLAGNTGQQNTEAPEKQTNLTHFLKPRLFSLEKKKLSYIEIGLKHLISLR